MNGAGARLIDARRFGSPTNGRVYALENIAKAQALLSLALSELVLGKDEDASDFLEASLYSLAVGMSYAGMEIIDTLDLAIDEVDKRRAP